MRSSPDRPTILTLCGVLLTVASLLLPFWISADIVPKVALVHHADHDPPAQDLWQAKIVFTNFSYSSALVGLKARWSFDCQPVHLALRTLVAGTQFVCDRGIPGAILSSSNVPAQGQIEAIFSRYEPFILPTPSVEAYEMIVRPDRVIQIPAQIFEVRTYEALQRKSHFYLGGTFALGVLLTLAIFLLAFKTSKRSPETPAHA
jgi:hypothetical protein